MFERSLSFDLWFYFTEKRPTLLFIEFYLVNSCTYFDITYDAFLFPNMNLNNVSANKFAESTRANVTGKFPDVHVYSVKCLRFIGEKIT